MNRDQLLKALTKVLLEKGAQEDVGLQLREQMWRFRHIYDKYNSWAFSEGDQIDTSFSIGEVRVDLAGAINVDVLISSKGAPASIAAKVRCEQSIVQ